MYVCGPTVYQRIHIGNARPFVISLWLQALARAQRLRRRRSSQNITDVNDKIYDAAPGASAELAARRRELVRRGHRRLGLGRPDHEPKATETIPEIVEMIERADRAPATRTRSSGDVYFRVASFPDYGQLSGPAARRGSRSRSRTR